MRLLHELQVHAAEVEVQHMTLSRTREALERAKSDYVDLYELAPVGYATLDVEGRIVEANMTLSKLLNTERRRLVGTKLAERVNPGDRASFEAAHSRLVGTATESLSLETSLRKDGGHFVSAMLEARRSLADGTSRIAIIDLARLQRTQALVREREARLAVVLDTLVGGIVPVDVGRRIDSCNSAALRLFGTSATWLVGQTVHSVLPGFMSIAERGRVELVAERADGSNFPAEVGVGELKLGIGDLKIARVERRRGPTKFV